MTWKIIDEEYTGFSAGDTVGHDISSYDLGYLFFNQAVKKIFRLGNTSSVAKNYGVIASGQNNDLNAGVEFSKNNIDWESAIFHSGVQPNSLSDTIYMRFTVPEESYITSGTFLIHVDEWDV